MFENKKIGVVVPCYNEENLIGKVIETMPDLVDRIYVVDDQSSDGTIAAVEKYVEEQPERVLLIAHRRQPRSRRCDRNRVQGGPGR